MLIPKQESDSVEFKTSFSDEVIISLVAFANAQGGVVNVGVADNGVVKGIEIHKETVQNWINEIKNKTASAIIPEVKITEIQNKSAIVLKIQEYPIKPVAFKGKCYKRIGSSNHLMSVEEIANEHLRTINTSWDFYIDPNHSLEAISLEKVNSYIQKVEQRTQTTIPYTPLEFLSKMEMLREGKLTFGAYLLFVSDYCLISDIQIGRFKSDITIIDSLSLHTDLFTEVEKIIAFIKKHLMVEYIITGEPQRTERFNYPLDAIREVVINMIVHRDYRDSSGSVIKIFDDRIEFYNPGKLFGGISILDLLSGNYTSKSRNKLIAKAFKEIGWIERYGSGILRIQNICEDYGVVEPAFEELANGFRVILFNEKLKVTDVGLNVGLNELYEIIKREPGINSKELHSGFDVTTRTIERWLKQLRENGKIEFRGAPKTGGYYVITDEN
ncbi:MAG: putative DNA binding domain-containing protein [Bacteroidetes bacterium]|nr:putative DNA binding domain-containing protein [Bacteroidota bacterium]